MRMTSFGLVGLWGGASESNALIALGRALVGLASRLVATPPRKQLRGAVLGYGGWGASVGEVDSVRIGGTSNFDVPTEVRVQLSSPR